MSPASIHRHLRAAGLIEPCPQKRPKSSYIRFAAEQPNERWQADFTHWRLAGNIHVEILNWIDDHARYALSVTAHRRVTGPIVVNQFRKAIATHGVPASTLTYDSPKTKGSRRRVPLMAATTELLRDYLAAHPRRDDPAAPLFCAVTLKAAKPTGKRATDSDGNRVVPTAVDALAALSVDEAAQRLALDWSAPIRHQTFYKAVFVRLLRVPTALAGLIRCCRPV